MKNRVRAVPTSLAIATLLAGCLTLSQPSPQIRDYRLDYPPPAVAGTPLAVVIGIPTLTVVAAYDRDSIVYREDSVSIGRYFYHRWTSNPGALVSDLLARDFTRSGLYTAIQSGRSPLRPNYQLLGVVEEIEERSVDGGCVAHLDLRLELLRVGIDPRSPVVLQRAYTEDEPSPCRDPRALTEAMSVAVSRLSATLQRDVYAAITADRGNGE